MEALKSFGNRYFEHSTSSRDLFFAGLGQMWDAVRQKHTEQIANAFIFTGVGGEDAQAYALEKFKTRFSLDERYVVMDFLNEYGCVPSYYKAGTDTQLRKEALEALKSSGISTASDSSRAES